MKCVQREGFESVWSPHVSYPILRSSRGGWADFRGREVPFSGEGWIKRKNGGVVQKDGK